jgi:hypothetical protein
MKLSTKTMQQVASETCDEIVDEDVDAVRYVFTPDDLLVFVEALKESGHIAAPEHPAAEVGTRVLHARPVRVCPICDIAECRTHAPEPAGAGAGAVPVNIDEFALQVARDIWNIKYSTVNETQGKAQIQVRVIEALRQWKPAPATPQQAAHKAIDDPGFDPHDCSAIPGRLEQAEATIAAAREALKFENRRMVPANPQPSQWADSDPDHGE